MVRQAERLEWAVPIVERCCVSSVLELSVNGSIHRVSADAERPLLLVLRDDLELTGTKIGCGEGECGTCTVVVDDELCRACITPVGAVTGKRIRTLEGLAENGQLHPLQQAFLEYGALQCGYCTAGMIMSAWALLQHNSAPTKPEIVAHMQGNICRCGCYPRIVQAIQQAAEQLSVRAGLEVPQ